MKNIGELDAGIYGPVFIVAMTTSEWAELNYLAGLYVKIGEEWPSKVEDILRQAHGEIEHERAMGHKSK